MTIQEIKVSIKEIEVEIRDLIERSSTEGRSFHPPQVDQLFLVKILLEKQLVIELEKALEDKRKEIA